MKYLIVAAALIVAGTAFAEDAVTAHTITPSQSTATPAPADGIYYLAVTQADLNTLGQAINELPKKIADPLVLKLDGQIRDQAKVISGAKAKP